MYRQFISHADYHRIVNEYSDPETKPHCNDTMFHEPGTCAFCDGYYRLNPEFKPASYVAREANGWGGNMAPIMDDAKAAVEQAEWDRMFERMSRGLE